MKKISNNTSLMSIVLGVSMLLCGMVAMGGATVIGIFGIIFGILYILAGLMTSLNLKNDALDLVQGVINMAILPLFIFIIYLISLINSAKGIGASGWILIILLLLSALLSSVIGIVSFFAQSEGLNKFLRIAVYLFIGFYIVMIVFPMGSGIATIGNIELLDILFLGCYYLISKSYLEMK